MRDNLMQVKATQVTSLTKKMASSGAASCWALDDRESV